MRARQGTQATWRPPHRLPPDGRTRSLSSPFPHLGGRQLLRGLLLVHECPGHAGQGFCSNRGGEGRSCVRVILDHFGEREGLGHGELGTAQSGLDKRAERSLRSYRRRRERSTMERTTLAPRGSQLPNPIRDLEPRKAASDLPQGRGWSGETQSAHVLTEASLQCRKPLVRPFHAATGLPRPWKFYEILQFGANDKAKSLESSLLPDTFLPKLAAHQL